MKMFDGNKLHHELLLTTWQKTKLRNAFEHMSADIKLSKTQISKVIQSGVFFRFFITSNNRSINKSNISTDKNILTTLAITGATPALDARIQKKIHGSGTTALIILDEKKNPIIKLFQGLEDSNILTFCLEDWKELFNWKWNKKTKRRNFRNITRNFRS